MPATFSNYPCGASNTAPSSTDHFWCPNNAAARQPTSKPVRTALSFSAMSPGSLPTPSHNADAPQHRDCCSLDREASVSGPANPNSSQINGMSTSAEHGGSPLLLLHAQNTRRDYPQTAPAATTTYNRNSFCSTSFLQRDSMQEPTLPAMQLAEEANTSPARDSFSTHIALSAPRVVPNPHISARASAVHSHVQLQRSPGQQTCGTGNLTEFDVSETRAAPLQEREESVTAEKNEEENGGDAVTTAPAAISQASATVSSGTSQSQTRSAEMSDGAPTAAHVRFAEEKKMRYACERPAVSQSTTTAPQLSITPPTTSAAVLDNKDHLTPVRTSRTAMRRSLVHGANGMPGRRPSFSSVPTVALSLASSIPPMTLTPQTVVDHFHDAYCNASYPPSPSVAHPDASSTHALRGVGEHAPAVTMVAPSAHVDDSDDDDGPPLLSSTRRQSLSETSSDEETETETEGAGAEHDGVASAADIAAAFAPVTVCPPTSSHDAAELPADTREVTSIQSSPPVVMRCHSPPEKSVTVVFASVAPTEYDHDDDDALPMTITAGGCPSAEHAHDTPLTWLSEVSPDASSAETSDAEEAGGDQGSERSAGSSGWRHATFATSPPPYSAPSSSHVSTSEGSSSLPATPPSPPLAASTTPPDVGSGGSKATSLPRRPPRPLFSNLTSPQQLSLTEPVVTSPAKARFVLDSGAEGMMIPAATAGVAGPHRTSHEVSSCAGSATVATSAVGASPPLRPQQPFASASAGATTTTTTTTFGGTNAAPRFSPPSSLPTSPDEPDLAQLVHQHVSQKIASTYAQSCSYYLHYHSKGGALALAPACPRTSYSCPNSPEDYAWERQERFGCHDPFDDDNDSDGDPQRRAEEERRRELEEDGGGATATDEEVEKSQLAASGNASTSVAECGVAESTRVSAPLPLPPQQQPRRRRFSCAVGSSPGHAGARGSTSLSSRPEVMDCADISP